MNTDSLSYLLFILQYFYVIVVISIQCSYFLCLNMIQLITLTLLYIYIKLFQSYKMSAGAREHFYHCAMYCPGMSQII